MADDKGGEDGYDPSDPGRAAGGGRRPPGCPRKPAEVCSSGVDGAAAMRRRRRPPEAAARNRVPLEGGLGERPGLAEAVVGRLVEPAVERAAPSSACPTAKPAAAGPARVVDGAPARASRDDLQAEGLGRTARRARRPASRRGSRAGPAPPIAAMR